jgi:hypothetical protein
MKPYPFCALNHLTVPVAMEFSNPAVVARAQPEVEI